MTRIKTNFSKIDFTLPFISLLFALLFSFWTVAYHIATFCYIPWNVLITALIFTSPVSILTAMYIARSFAASFFESVQDVPCPREMNTSVELILLLLSGLLIFYFSAYAYRFIIALITIAMLTWIPKKYGQTLSQDTGFRCVLSEPSKWLIILLLISIAVVITLCNYRSDFDDAEYIQMAIQTLQFPEKPPLVFDYSLGVILDQFRFAAHKVSSYELFAAFIAHIMNINVLTAYYMVLPAITAVLSMCIAYIFIRWFLPAQLALLATIIFLLIILSWGETHIAYGSRVFVRLFQGKGLLVAMTTPLTILAGFIFIQRTTWMNWMILFFTQIAAVGVSSSGLVITIVVTMLIMFVALSKGIKRGAVLIFFIGCTLIYPMSLGLWLKFLSSKIPVPLNQIGTFLPINASFGLSVREALMFIIIIFGWITFNKAQRNRDYRFICLGMLIIILNPWFSEIFSLLSARNMTWRIAWAAPMPLMLAIAITAVIFTPLCGLRKTKLSWVRSLLGFAILIGFMVCGHWAISSKNNVRWGIPQYKTPIEYGMALKINRYLQDLPTATILAPDRIGTWLTVTSPDIRLIMPGHGYIVALQTILPEREYNDRMTLLHYIDGQLKDFSDAVDLMKKFKISAIIALETHSDDFISYLMQDPRISLESVAQERPFTLLRIEYIE